MGAGKEETLEEARADLSSLYKALGLVPGALPAQRNKKEATSRWKMSKI